MDSSTRIVRFLLTGDSRGALEAQSEAEKGFEKTGSVADDTDKHIGLLHKSFEGLKNVVGYGAGALGLGAVAFGLKDVVQGGKQWQEQQAQLQNALKNTGQQGAGHMAALNHEIERSSTHGGFSPVEETRGLTQLINVTGKATTAIALNRTAVNLARGAHIEYSAALKLVARAQAGTAGRAQQYLGIIQPVKTYVNQLTEAQKKQNPEVLKHAELLDKQATAMEINRVVLEKYKGSTQAYSKTASGAMSNFKNTLELVEEALGRKLLPLVTKVAIALGEAATWVMDHWKQIGAVFTRVFNIVKYAFGIFYIATFIKWIVKGKQVAIALAVGVGAVVVPILAYNGAMALAAIATTAWGASIEFAADMLFLLTSPVSLIVIGIAALVAGVVYAYMHFKTFREVVNTSFSVIKNVVVDAVGFIGQHWKLLLALFALPLLPLVEIIKNFSKVKSAVETVFSGVGKFISGIFSGIVGTVTTGLNLIIKAINVPISGYDYVQKHVPFGLGAAQIKPLGEIANRPSTRTNHEHRTPAEPHHANTKIDLHLDGRKFAEALMKNPRGAKVITEGTALYTSKLQARA